MRLRICLFVVLAIALCGAVAEAGVLDGRYKQTDFPNLGLYIQVLDPETREPLMVLSPDKQPIECPPSQAPRDAIIRAIFLPNSGSRTTVCVKNREHDGMPEPEMIGGPYFQDYYPADDSWSYLIGPHIVKGVIRTDEGKWEPKAEVYTRTVFMADDIRYVLPTARRAPAPSQPIPAKAQLVRTLVSLSNGRFAMKVEIDLPTDLVVGDMLVFNYDGEQVAKAKITAVKPQVKANVFEGAGNDISDTDVVVYRTGQRPKRPAGGRPR